MFSTFAADMEVILSHPLFMDPTNLLLNNYHLNLELIFQHEQSVQAMISVTQWDDSEVSPLQMDGYELVVYQVQRSEKLFIVMSSTLQYINIQQLDRYNIVFWYIQEARLVIDIVIFRVHFCFPKEIQLTIP